MSDVGEDACPAWEVAGTIKRVHWAATRREHAMSDRQRLRTVTILAPGITISMLAFLAVTYFNPWHRRATLPDEPSPNGTTQAELVQTPQEDPKQVHARQRMLDSHLVDRGITDRGVLEAMGRIRRQEFVPEVFADVAYADRPLPIGHNQTISQPYIVALMTELVRPKATSRVLDIGTGSGYQTAVLAEICKEVYSIEIVRPLAEDARARLAGLGYKNVTVRHGDGYRGWPEQAPFDAILVAAAPEHVPQPLIDQLAPGGRLVIPVGRFFQELLLIEKQPDGTVKRYVVAGVAFVPMTGEAEEVGKK